MGSELTDSWRAKYPGAYDNVPDDQLEKAIIAKFPGAYDHLTDSSNDTKVDNTSAKSADTKLIESKPNEQSTGKPNKLSDLWNNVVNNPTIKHALTGHNDELDQLMKDKGITNIQGPGLMTIPGLDKLGETIKNKGINTGNYWAGFGGSLAKDLIDMVSSGFDHRAAGIKKSPNDLFPVDHDFNPNELTDIKAMAPEIAQRAMSNQPSMPRSNNIDINPNEAALSEDTLGKQIAAHRATELDKIRGSESDIPNNDVARRLELERKGTIDLSNKSSSKIILDRELRGAKPRYNIGQDTYIPKFESDLDKALFIIAQKNPSARNADYLKFVMKHTGLDESGAVNAGQSLRNQLKNIFKNSEPGEVDIPRINNFENKKFSSLNLPNIEQPNKPNLSVDEVNKLFTDTKPLAEGTTVNFNNAKQLANNKKLGVQPNEPIIINDPRELNTDQIRKVYMKENPSNTSSPNILMQAPDVNKVKEANSYGYKSAGYTQDGSLKLERKGTYPKTINPVNKESLAQSIYDLPRGLMSVDPPFITSAAFRQAGPLIGTKQWFKSWIPAAKAFGSEVASSNIEDSLRNHPLVKDVLDKSGNVQPGYAKRIGVNLTSLDEGLNNREEAIRSDLAEKIPLYGRYVRGSNRAYKTFLNTLRVGTLEDIVNGATADQSIGSKLNPFSLQSFGNSDPLNNAVLGKQIGDFINNATGRGSLGPLEDHVKLLSNVLFSPRGIAAKVQMFNPMNYVATEPLVRQQYIKAAARQAGAWWAMAGLSTLAGATVSRDPNSADFGKIKIGNTRIDPPGGLQQFLVLGNRMLPESMGGGGITSTTTNKFKSFGSGFKPNTRMSTLGQFGINRLHPTLKLAYDFLDANPNKPFHVGDQMISHVAPLFAGDLMDVAKDNPGLLPIVLPLAGAGMGTQSYEKGSFGKSTFLPEDMDINVGAK